MCILLMISVQCGRRTADLYVELLSHFPAEGPFWGLIWIYLFMRTASSQSMHDSYDQLATVSPLLPRHSI